MSQDMIVSILPGGQPGSAWRQPHQQLALAMRLLIFAVGGITAYAVSHCDMSRGFMICSLCCFVSEACAAYNACPALWYAAILQHVV